MAVTSQKLYQPFYKYVINSTSKILWGKKLKCRSPDTLWVNVKDVSYHPHVYTYLYSCMCHTYTHTNEILVKSLSLKQDNKNILGVEGNTFAIIS